MSDLIKREDAIKAMEQRYQDILRTFKRKVKDGEKAIALDMIGCIKTLPSADTDISEYSDKLWRNAYERGKADRPQGWIPCSERLPNEKEVVLITNDKGNVRFGQFRGTHGKYWIWKGNTLETVLAWMPLPKPWKGADDETD